MQCSYVRFLPVTVWHWCDINVGTWETGMSCHTAPSATGTAWPRPALCNQFPACVTQHTHTGLHSFWASEDQFVPPSRPWLHFSDCKERNCSGIGKTQTKILCLSFSLTLVGTKVMYIVNPLRRGITERLYRMQFCNPFLFFQSHLKPYFCKARYGSPILKFTLGLSFLCSCVCNYSAENGIFLLWHSKGFSRTMQCQFCAGAE